MVIANLLDKFIQLTYSVILRKQTSCQTDLRQQHYRLQHTGWKRNFQEHRLQETSVSASQCRPHCDPHPLRARCNHKGEQSTKLTNGQQQGPDTLTVSSHGELPTGESTLKWGLVCQKQVSRAWTSNYIPQYLWDVITCPCPWSLILAHTSSSGNKLLVSFSYTKGESYVWDNYRVVLNSSLRLWIWTEIVLKGNIIPYVLAITSVNHNSVFFLF